MMKLFHYIVGIVGSFIDLILTGGKFGSSTPSKHSYNYAKSQEQRRKDFAEYGGHDCKICGTRIPGNKSYCAPCYFNYRKKH